MMLEPKHYTLVVHPTVDGDRYGFGCRADGTLELFGEYRPDERTHVLLELLAGAMTKVRIFQAVRTDLSDHDIETAIAYARSLACPHGHIVDGVCQACGEDRRLPATERAEAVEAVLVECRLRRQRTRLAADIGVDVVMDYVREHWPHTRASSGVMQEEVLMLLAELRQHRLQAKADQSTPHPDPLGASERLLAELRQNEADRVAKKLASSGFYGTLGQGRKGTEVPWYEEPAYRIPASSNLEAARYLADRQALEIKFKGGDVVYRYTGVPTAVWADFQAAKSKGRFHHKHIKAAFPYEKVET